MKGKKFTAAEKHFRKKEEAYLKRIKALEGLLAAKTEADHAQVMRIKELREQNDTLIVQNTKLLELCQLTKDEIRTMCEKDKYMEGLVNIMNFMNKANSL